MKHIILLFTLTLAQNDAQLERLQIKELAVDMHNA